MKALLALIVFVSAAQAQVAELVPEAARMAAPDWVKPGVRLTWYTSDSTSQDAYVAPAGPGEGDMEDGAGRRGKLMGRSGVGGMGYQEVYILATEPGKVVYEYRYYLILGNKPSGPAPMRIIAGAVSTTPGAVGELWIHPAALVKLREEGHAGFKIAVGKHSGSGEERDALWIGTDADAGKTSWAYDLTSGILLSKGSSGKGARGLGGFGKDGTDLRGRNRASNYMAFREYKQLDLPWLGQPNPDWVARTRRIEFGGHARIIHPEARGLAPVPFSQRFDRVENGATWAVFKHTMVDAPRALLDGGTYLGMPLEPGRATFVSGAGSPSSLWVPVAAIGRLTRGQMLAKSAVTGFTTSVFYVGPDRGADVCVIRWENPLQTMDYVYDRTSGRLLRVVNTDKPLQRQVVAILEKTE